MAGKKQLYLTEGQKECLRMVDDLLTSKEIARKLGISRFTVDQRLDAARRKLNAPNRKEAAKIHLAFEARCLSESIVYEPEDFAAFGLQSIPPANRGVEAKLSDCECSVGKVNQVRQIPTTDEPRSFNGVMWELLETGLISIIMVMAMTLIMAKLMRTLILI